MSGLPSTEYLTPQDPDAFVDWPSVEEVRAKFDHWHPSRSLAVACPKCHGRGGWNLRVNAYPMPFSIPDVPVNRHRFAHFRASCNQCAGWGYVDPGPDSQCVHVWDRGVTVGRCLTDYTCTKCGTVSRVDSSD